MMYVISVIKKVLIISLLHRYFRKIILHLFAWYFKVVIECFKLKQKYVAIKRSRYTLLVLRLGLYRGNLQESDVVVLLLITEVHQSLLDIFRRRVYVLSRIKGMP